MHGKRLARTTRRHRRMILPDSRAPVHGTFATPESGEREGEEHPDPNCLGHGSFVAGRSVDGRVSTTTNDTRGISQRIRVVTRAREAMHCRSTSRLPGADTRAIRASSAAHCRVRSKTSDATGSGSTSNVSGSESANPGRGIEYRERIPHGHECVRRDIDLIAWPDAGEQRTHPERVGTPVTRYSPLPKPSLGRRRAIRPVGGHGLPPADMRHPAGTWSAVTSGVSTRGHHSGRPVRGMTCTVATAPSGRSPARAHCR